MKMRTSRFNLCWVTLLMAAFLSGCTDSSRDERTPHAAGEARPLSKGIEVSREELSLVLVSGQVAQAIDVMNRIKAMQHQGDLLPALLEVWDGKLDNFPKVNRAFIDSPRIRIEVADILIQAERNGLINGRARELAVYARQLSTSQDVDVARQAILVLGVVNAPEDVAFLTRLIDSESAGTFNVAAVSFSRNCAADASKIKMIATSLKSAENRALLLSVWDSNQLLRAAICEGKRKQ
ncbi:MAG: hypothetical protein ACK5UX_04825 [Burkholderiales bacterium]|jgi:hypothetical protein